MELLIRWLEYNDITYTPLIITQTKNNITYSSPLPVKNNEEGLRILGYIFRNDLSWSTHISQLVANTSTVLSKISQAKASIPAKIKLVNFDAFGKLTFSADVATMGNLKTIIKRAKERCFSCKLQEMLPVSYYTWVPINPVISQILYQHVKHD